MAQSRSEARGRSIWGILLLLIALAIGYWIWTLPPDPPVAETVPTLTRPMVADLTGFDEGDTNRPYPIRVYVNVDRTGTIVMNFRDKQYSQRFRYDVRGANDQQVNIQFFAQLFGTDQMGPGEIYALSLTKGGGAVLVWFNRSASGRWVFGPS